MAAPMTSYASAAPSTSWASPSTTSYVNIYVRETSSAGSSSSSHSRSSSSTSSKCTDAQYCQTGTNMTGMTIGLAVGIPVGVFLLIIAALIFRAYRKNKKETKEEIDNDPDFYGDSTALPDYPTSKAFYNGEDSRSLYSSSLQQNNPFAESARYPSGAFSSRTAGAGGQQQGSLYNYGNGPQSSGAIYDAFSLPYEQNLGSKHSLDEFSRHMGSEYQAYQLAQTTSRSTSRPHSPYMTPNSSSWDIAGGRNTSRNLMIEKTNSDEPTTTSHSSRSFPENKHVSPARGYDVDEHPVEDGDVKGRRRTLHEDEHPLEPQGLHDPKKSRDFDHDKRRSDLSFVENEPERLNHKVVAFNEPVKEEGVEEEEDEDIKRMKSVYRVYFDRENSMKSTKSAKSTTVEEDEDRVPPLPDINVQGLNEDEHGVPPQAESSDEDDFHFDQAEAGSKNNDTLGVSTQKPPRAVSSIYSTVPLQFGQDQQRYPQAPEQSYQQYPQQDYQQYPQQYPQQHSQQYPQQYSQQHPQQFQSSPQHIYQPHRLPYQQQQHSSSSSSLQEPLDKIPNPSRIDYNSIVSDTQYAPTKSLTGGTRPPKLAVKPFNPLHYSDQIFSPTSPSSPYSPQFQQPQPSSASTNDQSIPSPHHIRQSIVMVNPVEIGKQKLYRPAGSFQQQMNSANSSRAASLTSQSYAPPPPANVTSTDLPRSGSQADLRKQLGSSENYHFN
ncbi:SKG6-domain-containing protein [Cyberlindnera jadinii NRRL Y-1542]|uniref:SKG6-domain-containing protein n=1 Tax=Cyberlindnera jadinii (strain ATCC 18201 / CBS 1600 / BCRC 20928 / JCM 3617 / NBRC 0987 / NRRL Y-1542) TaxID=983966 RepID=A0A1E4S4H1_CYBJN|nr:SKG6-domain-containing protein [Cyberlindnera jadinii NRRL Y-1542]ODV74418.1 SKG6-domain-containing protein [Cyberlindnera jadinii NRRL Y-1542]